MCREAQRTAVTCENADKREPAPSDRAVYASAPRSILARASSPDQYVCPETAVTTSVLDRLRQLRRELREYAGEAHEQVWLQETAQHIPLVNAMARRTSARLTSCSEPEPASNLQTASWPTRFSAAPRREHPSPRTRTALPTLCSSRSTARRPQQGMPHRTGRPSAQIAGREARPAGIRPLSSSLSAWCCYRAVPSA
jgi:hypothetical protein